MDGRTNQRFLVLFKGIESNYFFALFSGNDYLKAVNNYRNEFRVHREIPCTTKKGE